MRFAALLLTVFLLASSCTDTPGAKTGTDHGLAIDSLYMQFSEAYRTKDLQLVSSLYAEDAAYIPGSSQMSILQGRDSIQNTFASYFEQSRAGGRDLDISFKIIKREVGDSLAYDVGYYLLRAKEKGAAEFPEGGSVGKFVTVLGLQEDGSWRFLLDGFSPAPFEAFGHASDVRR